jgi:hypothetical protein
VAWFGDLAKRPSQRVATVLATDGRGEPTAVRSIAEREVDEAVVASGIGRFVYEPHPAVLAAHLVRCLAVECRLSFFAPGIAYLTGDDCIEDAALSCFRVAAVMPYRTRRIKQFLSQRRAGRLEVKKRGVALDPEAVRRELAVPGDHRMTLILASVRRSTVAILAERVRGAKPNRAEALL